VDPLRWKRIEELFAAARPLDGDSRIAFLKENCGQDEDLFQQVNSLLEMDGKPGPLDAAPTVSTLNIAQIVDNRFRIIRYIAEGGMGTVYEAEDLQLHDHVALKTIRPDIASDPRAVERFKREISLGKRVTHPNVCRIHDLGVDRSKNGHGVLFLTMQFLSGETLASRIRRGPLPTSEALPLIEDMADALSAAHEVDVIHRDFKSGNVMLVHGAHRTCAVVTDFGLARAMRDSASLTQSGIVGTVEYMAPEQIKGSEITPATDIYALGVVMYEMVTGQRPFTGDAKVTIALKHLNDEPQPPRALAPHLEPQWDDAILGCMQKLPGDRFQSAAEIKDALAKDGVRPHGRVARRGAARRIKPRLIVLAGVLATALILVSILLVPAIRERVRGVLFPKSKEGTALAANRAAYEDYLAGVGYFQRYDKNGYIENAITALEKAVKTDPYFAVGFARLAEVYAMRYRLENNPEWLEKAEWNARRAAELDNRASATHVALGQVHEMRRDYDLATDEFQRAISLDPRDADAVEGMAETYKNAGRNTDAEAAYIKATALRPDDWRGYNDLGILYESINRPQDAIAQYNRALQLTPDNSWAYTNLAIAYMDFNDPKMTTEAEKALKKSIAINPTFGAYSNLAFLYADQHRFRESVAASLEAVNLNPNNRDVWVNLADAYEWLKDDENARIARRKAIPLLESAVKPGSRDARGQATLAVLYAKEGSRSKAIDSIQNSLALSPEDQYVSAQVADAYELLGNRREAIRYLEKAVAQGWTRELLNEDPYIQGVLSDPSFRMPGT